MKTTMNIRMLAVMMIGSISLCLYPVAAQIALTTEHVDFGLGEGPGLEPHWHDETNNIEYQPNEAFAFIDPVEAINSRPAGAQWDFLGMAAGENVWILPQSSDPDLLFLGIGAEEVDPGTFDIWNPGDPRGGKNVPARWLRMQLTSFSGPGQFSMFQGFTPTVWMSTLAAPAAGNYFYVVEGGHDHVNWAFSELGVYELTFEVMGFIGGNPVTDTGTFTFSTMNPLPIPEPSTYAMLIFGAICVGVAVVRVRRKNVA